jgi:hypothetical protein
MQDAPICKGETEHSNVDIRPEKLPDLLAVVRRPWIIEQIVVEAKMKRTKLRWFVSTDSKLGHGTKTTGWSMTPTESPLRFTRRPAGLMNLMN